MINDHKLKSWPIYFTEIITGAKTFEYRKNDRDFQREDTLQLCEWDNVEKKYTGRYARVVVTGIWHGSWHAERLLHYVNKTFSILVCFRNVKKK